MHGHEVHVGVVIGVEGPDIAPVAAITIRGSRHHIESEVVDARPALVDKHGDDVAAHVVHRALVGRIGTENVDERVRGEDVIAHGDVGLVFGARDPGRVGGLLEEAADAHPILRGVDDTELVGERPGLANARHRDRSPGVDVRLHHLHGIHAIDVVGSEDRDVVGPLIVDEVEALEDRVGTSGEPPRTQALLRGDRGDVIAEERRQPPGRGDVTVQGVGLVLGEHRDPPQA